MSFPAVVHRAFPLAVLAIVGALVVSAAAPSLITGAAQLSIPRFDVAQKAAAGAADDAQEGRSALDGANAEVIVTGVDAAGSGTHVRSLASGEFAKAGDPRWPIRHWSSRHEIEGFANRVSVRPGGSVVLRVSTPARTYRISAYRFGPYRGAVARLVWRSARMRGQRQAAATVSSTLRTVSVRWRSGPLVSTKGWPEGAYLLRLDASSGWQTWVPLILRSASVKGRVLLVSGTNTWEAYNAWGGRSAYSGPSGFRSRSLAMTFDRPYDAKGVGQFFRFEQPLFLHAEALGLPVAYATDVDVATGAINMYRPRAVVIPGHAEYWARTLTDRIVAVRNRGTNVFFAGANEMYWRVRYQRTSLGANRLMVIYKTTPDPIATRDPRDATTLFRLPPAAFPENRLVGMSYECFPASGRYRVQDPTFWAFARAHVTKGTTFPGLVGVEIDRAHVGGATPRPLQVVAHSTSTCGGRSHFQDSTYCTTTSGAGVFAVGTMRWVVALRGSREYGLTARSDAFVGAVTDEVLRQFSSGPAGIHHRAHDNLTNTYR